MKSMPSSGASAAGAADGASAWSGAPPAARRSRRAHAAGARRPSRRAAEGAGDDGSGARGVDGVAPNPARGARRSRRQRRTTRATTATSSSAPSSGLRTRTRARNATYAGTPVATIASRRRASRGRVAEGQNAPEHPDVHDDEEQQAPAGSRAPGTGAPRPGRRTRSTMTAATVSVEKATIANIVKRTSWSKLPAEQLHRRDTAPCARSATSGTPVRGCRRPTGAKKSPSARHRLVDARPHEHRRLHRAEDADGDERREHRRGRRPAEHAARRHARAASAARELGERHRAQVDRVDGEVEHDAETGPQREGPAERLAPDRASRRRRTWPRSSRCTRRAPG